MKFSGESSCQRARRFFLLLAIVTLAVDCAMQTARAADQTKADNATSLDQAGSWVGNAVPGSGDRAIWDGTLSAANCTNTVTVTAINVGQIQIKSPSGGVPVSISGASSGWWRLIGVNGAAIDMSAAAVDLNIGSGFTVQSWTAGTFFTNQAGRTLTISGQLYVGSGAGQALTLDGGGNYVFSGLLYGQGIFIKQGSGALTITQPNYACTNFVLNAGKFNLNHAYAINGYANSTMTINGGTIDNTSGGTIALNNNPPSYFWYGDFTFAGTGSLNLGSGIVILGGNRQVTCNASILTVGGVISDGSSGYSLTKAGAGTLTLSGANTYSGNTIVSAGTLALSGSGSIANSPLISLAGGATLGVSGLAAAATLSSGQILQAGGSTNSATLATTTGKGLTLASTSPLQFPAFKPAGSGGAVPLMLSGSGNLTLGAGTPVTITVANGGTALTAAGSPYKLIEKGASGTVATLPGGLLTVNGDGANGTASLSVSNSELYLVIAGSSIFTTTTLALTSGNPIYGNNGGLTFTATVKTNGLTAVNATSNFVFSVDGLPVTTNSVSGGAATYTTAGNFAAGSHLIFAKYCGDATYKPSSNTLMQIVSPLPVALTGTRAYDGTTNAAYGILTITNILGTDDVFLVSGSAGLAGANTGVEPIVSPNTLTLGGAQAANYSVAGLTGSVLIIQASSSLLLASSAQPSGWQQPVTFAATVQNNGLAATDAAGSVTFLTNGVPLCSSNVFAGMTYSLTITNLPAGTNLITAWYSGDANYSASTNTLNQIVNPPQTTSVTFSNSLMAITIGTNGTVTSVKRQDTGAQVNNGSLGWYVNNGSNISFTHMTVLGTNTLMFWSSNGQYSATFAVTSNNRYLKFALVHVSNNPQTGNLDASWPGCAVAMSLATTSQSDGWTLNTAPLDYMISINIYNAFPLSWPYVQFSQTNAFVYPNGLTTNNIQPMGAVAIFPSTGSAQHDDILLDIWSGEPTPPRPNRANLTSWTRADASAWLDRFERELPPSRAVMFAPNNLSDLYQVANIMFTNKLNSLYLFNQYWQGSNPAINGLNPALFPNGTADLTSLQQYCAQRGISLWFHGNAGYVNVGDTLWGDYSPTGLSSNLSRCATGTLLNGINSSSTAFDVQPDPGCQPFTTGTPSPPNYPGTFSSYVSISNDLCTCSVTVVSPTDWQITGFNHVGSSQWSQNHAAGCRVDFLPNYGGYSLIPDSRSSLLATQAQAFATLLNQFQVTYDNYDGQDKNFDLGTWGLGRFSQGVFETLDHPVHASLAGLNAPFGHFEYLFNRIQKHEGAKAFALEVSEIGGLASLRLWDPSFMATHLDEDQWAFGVSAGWSPNFMIFGYHIGTDLNTITNQGWWSQVVSNLNLWQAVAPYLTTSQQATLKSFATDFYVPSQTGNQWQITPTRAMLRNGVDNPWQLMVERGPISPHQFNKADGTSLSPLANPYLAQTPQIEFLVLPGMSATNANNVSLLAASPLSFTNATNAYSWSPSAAGLSSPYNLSASRGVAITVNGDNSGSVLAFHIGGRDYALKVNFSGTQTIEIPNGEAVWYRADLANSTDTGFSGTADTFNYANATSLGLSLRYVPNGVTPGISVSDIKAMKEDQATGLVNPVLTLNGNSAAVVGTIPYNNYLTYNGGSSAQIYDQNWNFKSSLPVTGANLTAVNGANTFSVTATNSPNAWMATRVKVSGTPWVINKPSPTHEWRFENNTLDTVGTANGVAINGPAYVTGIEGVAALSFNGVNQYVNLTNIPGFQFTSTQSFTLSAWVKLKNLPNARSTIVETDPTAGAWYGLGITAANQWAFFGATDIVSSVTADVGQWHLLAAVQDGTGGTRKLYSDGLLLVSGWAQAANGSGALGIGAMPGAAPSQFLNGSIDDVRIYNQALAPTDIGLLATNLAAAANRIITYSVGGGQLVLNWPANQLWQLQIQTNNLGTGLTTNWFNVTGAVPPYTVTLSPTNPTVFYRLSHP